MEWNVVHFFKCVLGVDKGIKGKGKEKKSYIVIPFTSFFFSSLSKLKWIWYTTISLKEWVFLPLFFGMLKKKMNRVSISSKSFNSFLFNISNRRIYRFFFLINKISFNPFHFIHHPPPPHKKKKKKNYLYNRIATLSSWFNRPTLIPFPFLPSTLISSPSSKHIILIRFNHVITMMNATQKILSS